MKNSSSKLASKISILCTGLLFAFCSPPKETEKITFVEKKSINLEDTIPYGKKGEGDAHGGKFFSRADSSSIYGCTSFFNIPDSLVQKDIRVRVNAWVRIGDLSKNKKYAISLEDAFGKMINWGEVDFRSHVAEVNKWVNVSDSVTISANLISNKGLIIKTFSFNPDGHSHLDVDDVELVFCKVEKNIEK
jgi:hypothetical protein